MSSFFFWTLVFFCWREGRFSDKKLTRNKELTCDGLRRLFMLGILNIKIIEIWENISVTLTSHILGM